MDVIIFQLKDDPVYDKQKTLCVKLEEAKQLEVQHRKQLEESELEENNLETQIREESKREALASAKLEKLGKLSIKTLPENYTKKKVISICDRKFRYSLKISFF